jgi:hypothetical protein
MSERKPPYLAYFAVALFAFLMIVEGFEVLARVQIRGQSLAEGLSETTHYAVVQFAGTFASALPFVAVAWICASVAKKSLKWAVSLMTVCLTAFAFMYFRGCMDAQEYLLQQSWTAAALAVGLIPFMCIPVVLFALIFRFALVRKQASAQA